MIFCSILGWSLRILDRLSDILIFIKRTRIFSRGSSPSCSWRSISARASLRISCYACQNMSETSIKCTNGFSLRCHGRMLTQMVWHIELFGKKAKERKEALHLKEPIGSFPLMVMISSWTSRTVPSRLWYTVV